jgi:stage II sporulation protein D
VFTVFQALKQRKQRARCCGGLRNDLISVGTSTRVLFALVFLGLPFACVAQDVRVGVFGLFHPQELVVSSASGSSLVVKAGERTLVLGTNSGVGEIRIFASGQGIKVETGKGEIQAASINAMSHDNGSSDFTLAIPGKISRRYHGMLRVESSDHSLVAVVTMDLETAVASVVAAESTSNTPIEALEAQAVVARSYLLAAKGRHPNFDFCDTTHCQFLRNPPGSTTTVGVAVVKTRGLVLMYEAEPIAAMYSRSCGGRTLTPSDVGLPHGRYPYYSVACKYCRQNPVHWHSAIALQEAADLKPGNESARLDIDRLLGWSTVPSNNFIMQRHGDRVLLQGVGEGHGIGLCQLGAAAMARDGASFQQILSHYYPNTAIAPMVSNYAVP